MAHDVPMLADFGARLGFGLAAMLLVTSWRDVPLAFFRTHCYVILGVLVLATLDAYRSGSGNHGVLLALAVCLTYAAGVCWGLGLPNLAIPTLRAIVVITALWLVLLSQMATPWDWGLNALSRMLSGLLIASTLTAMLLGHHYLTAPTMSIQPLERVVGFMGWSLGLRGLLALMGLLIAYVNMHGEGVGTHDPGLPLFLLMRWGMGFLGPVLATVLAWKTVRIRSTQSATGILYVALALVLFGELTALIAARAGGLIG